MDELIDKLIDVLMEGLNLAGCDTDVDYISLEGMLLFRVRGKGGIS